MQKPPMVIYTYLLADVLRPDDFRFARILATLFVAAATVLLGYAARKEFGPRAGWAAMILFTPMILLPDVQQFSAQPEQFLLLPMLALFSLYIGNRPTASVMTWYWSGVLAALAVLYKYTCLPIALYIFAAWTVDEWSGQASVKRMLAKGSAAALGVVCAGTVVLSYFVFVDWGRSLYECTVAFNRLYVSAYGSPIHSFAGNMHSIVRAWWLLGAFTVCFWLFRPRRWLFYSGLFLAAMVSTAGGKYGHYYVLLMPFWAIIAAVSLTVCVEKLPTRLRWSGAGVWICLVLVVVASLVYPAKSTLRMLPRELEEVRYAGFPFSESLRLADKVVAATSPDDYVFVAGSEPEILYYAKRRSSTRFVIMYPLVLPTAMAEKLQQEAIGELEEHPPRVIVLARHQNSWLINRDSPPWFGSYLRKLLRKYRAVGGFVRNAGSVQWEEPIYANRIDASSLVLYVKNDRFVTEEEDIHRINGGD